MTPFCYQKNLASIPFRNFACSKGLQRARLRPEYFERNAINPVNWFKVEEEEKGVCVLNSISGGSGDFPFPRLLSKSTYTFLEQVKKLSKSMECVWWDCKSEKHQTESAGVWSDEHLSLLLLSFPFILLLKPKNYRAKNALVF